MNRYWHIPTIFHFIVYFDADDGCHDLNLSIGQNAVYATEPSNRQISIKVRIFQKSILQPVFAL